MALVEIHGLTKSYQLDGKHIDVLRGVDLVLEPGELVALTGPSGAGKSTFLQVLGTLDTPTSGTVRIDGAEVGTLPEDELADFRNQTIGFVFQSHHLLPEFTALENVMMPGLIHRLGSKEAEQRAADLLGRVGLSERLGHKPGELSGGEQQRVAIARALIMRPKLLLADEPTGNLDPATGEGIHALLSELNRSLGITAVVATHNEGLAGKMSRRLRLSEGRIADSAARDL